MGRLRAGRGASSMFLYPGRSLRVGGVLIANFRLPLSMVLMRVAAFAEIAYDGQ